MKVYLPFLKCKIQFVSYNKEQNISLDNISGPLETIVLKGKKHMETNKFLPPKLE
jgi:hypothetical protein